MSAPPALLEALRGLDQVLDREDLRWYVFGAQAVVVYGQPRLTADLDVTVEASLERVLALIPALREAGFAPRSSEPAELLHRARVLPLVHEPSGLAVLDRSRRFLRMLEQALDRSDLVPVLERLVEASR